LGKFIDLTGQRFGKLVVIERSENNKKGSAKWLCECNCGRTTEVLSYDLTSNHTKSCGCLRYEKGHDLIGMKFGRWTVIKKDKNKKGSRSWFCKCDCGNHKVITSYSLVNGHSKSCGCLQKEKISQRFKKEFKMASFNRLYTRYKREAKARNLKFDLTKLQFNDITKKNCYYCGTNPQYIIKNEYQNGDYIYNGIDRIDNAKGYTVDNIAPCCGICNIAKRSMSKEEFLLWIERVYKHSIENNQIKENK